MQLELFQKSEMEVLREEIESVKKSSENVRRGIFSRNNELTYLVMDLRKELDDIKNRLLAIK